MILHGIKRAAPFALMAAVVSGCMAPLPGGETGPFAPGNTLTFYYQTVLTDPPDEAALFECGDQFIGRTCVRQSNGAEFQLNATETGGVTYGNSEQQIVLQLDAGGVPSGVGQINDTTTGDVTGMRWVSLPSR